MLPPARDLHLLGIGDTLRDLLTTVLPEGGQRTARRNAWEAVCADRVRARGRQEAWRDMDRLSARMDQPSSRHSSSA